MARRNEEIRTLIAELARRAKQLQLALDGARSHEDALALVRELQEVNHRLTIAGSLLFAAQSKELAAKVAIVKTASSRAAKSLRAIENARDAMRALTEFLSLVDEALDLAKAL